MGLAAEPEELQAVKIRIVATKISSGVKAFFLKPLIPFFLNFTIRITIMKLIHVFLLMYIHERFDVTLIILYVVFSGLHGCQEIFAISTCVSLYCSIMIEL